MVSPVGWQSVCGTISSGTKAAAGGACSVEVYVVMLALPSVVLSGVSDQQLGVQRHKACCRIHFQPHLSAVQPLFNRLLLVLQAYCFSLQQLWCCGGAGSPRCWGLLGVRLRVPPRQLVATRIEMLMPPVPRQQGGKCSSRCLTPAVQVMQYACDSHTRHMCLLLLGNAGMQCHSCSCA